MQDALIFQKLYVEIRVYVISVDSDFDFKYHYNNGDFTSIIDEAEKNGDVLTYAIF